MVGILLKAIQLGVVSTASANGKVFPDEAGRPEQNWLSR